MLRLLRLDSPEEHRHASDSPQGRLLAACGLDRFKAKAVAESPVASKWEGEWWPRGHVGKKRNEPRKAHELWHLREERRRFEKKKAASILKCRERSTISAVGGLSTGHYGRGIGLTGGSDLLKNDEFGSIFLAYKNPPTFQLLTPRLPQVVVLARGFEPAFLQQENAIGIAQRRQPNDRFPAPTG